MWEEGKLWYVCLVCCILCLVEKKALSTIHRKVIDFLERKNWVLPVLFPTSGSHNGTLMFRDIIVPVEKTYFNVSLDREIKCLPSMTALETWMYKSEITIKISTHLVSVSCPEFTKRPNSHLRTTLKRTLWTFHKTADPLAGLLNRGVVITSASFQRGLHWSLI